MPEVEMLLCGFNANTDQARLGLSMVTLVRGSRNTLVDVGHFGRRQLLVQALEQRSLRPHSLTSMLFILHNIFPATVEYSSPRCLRWRLAFKSLMGSEEVVVHKPAV